MYFKLNNCIYNYNNILAKKTLPRSTSNPNIALKGFGTMITVELKLTKYTMRSGREAMVGNHNL